MIHATPSETSFPVSDFLMFSAMEKSDIAKQCKLGSGKCSIPVHVALFFDGTKNNLYRYKFGRRIGVPNGAGEPTPINNKQIAPEAADHLVFGTPDGKEKWKTRGEPDKAFDISEDARQVFPDRPRDDDE
ncbi:hypothetical protein [Pseudoduganella sp. HUAS MS19]